MKPFKNIVLTFIFSLFLTINGCAFKKDNTISIIPNTKTTTNLYDIKLAYKYLSDNVDKYEDPCDDFFSFTCKKWIDKHSNEDAEKGYISVLEDIKNRYRTFVKEVDDGELSLNSTAISKLQKMSKNCNLLNDTQATFCHTILNRVKACPYNVYFYHMNVNSTKFSESIDIVNNMIEKFKYELRNIIYEKDDVFDDKSKTSLVLKLENMKLNIRFLKLLYNISFLENCYEYITFEEDENPRETYLNMFYINQTLSNIFENSTNDCLILLRNNQLFFAMEEEEPLLKYNFRGKNLLLSPLMLLDPIFNPSLPAFYNFGAFGSILAQEIMFDFFTKYIYLNHKTKVSSKYITADSLKNFNNKAKCFIKQYNNERIDIINEKINGSKTLQNNIAANSGIKIAHRAFMAYIDKNKDKEPQIKGFENYTMEQLFFISFGMVNCEKYSLTGAYDTTRLSSRTPFQVSVRGVLKNYKPFSNVFNCKEGKKMNPKNKCEIW